MPSLPWLKSAADHADAVCESLREALAKQLAKGDEDKAEATELELMTAELHAEAARAAYETARALLAPTDPGLSQAGASGSAFNATVRVEES